MSTTVSPPSAATWPPFLLSEEQAAKLKVLFYFAIIHCLSVVGICGNVMSMLLLARQGFRKPSNVLLFPLALADVLYLTGINNFSSHHQAENVPSGYAFSENLNYLFYIFYMMLQGAQYIGVCCSVLIPVLITGERLLVIFSPLKVRTLVTPMMTLIVVLCVCAFSLACFVYQYVLCYRFEQALIKGVSLGRIVIAERLNQDLKSGAYWLFEDIVNYTTAVVPMVLVTLGCSVIGLKVVLIAKRRKQLTSKCVPFLKSRLLSEGVTSTNRQITSGDVTSTKTPFSLKTISKSSRVLLSVCALYISCSFFGFSFVYVIRSPALQNEKPLRIVFNYLNTFSQCINSVGNFIIYVAANGNFRYKDLKPGCYVKRRGSQGV